MCGFAAVNSHNSMAFSIILDKTKKHGIIVLNRTMVREEIYFCSFGINIKR